MKQQIIALSALAGIALATAGCGSSGETSEAVQSVYDTCAARSDEVGAALSLSGNTISIKVEASDFTGAAVLLIAVGCVADEAGYPGTSRDIKNGESWDGWKFTEGDQGNTYVGTFAYSG